MDTGKLRFQLMMFLVGLTWATGAQPQETLQRAHEAMALQDYEAAMTLYTSLTNQGYASLTLYYNLGSAHLELGQKAMARYYLEQARIYKPLHPDVMSKLQSLRDQVGDTYRLPAFPTDGLVEWYRSHLGHSFVACALLICTVVAFGLAWCRPARWRRWLAAIAAVWCLMGLVLVCELLWLRQQQRQAVVLEGGRPLLTFPDDESTVLNLLAEGHLVQVTQQLGPWIKVELGDGASGWLQEGQVKSMKNW